ncbi:MAG: hypothetical protein HN919_20095 [Verrucomicrobia bacterium]|jgi:hypothetical protein|nr:hypothetical protein [Verrucomicrobiota bacterium]MBT7068608.1 hypothetical protein [Verrucomicrobiota bacterium]MBT7698728.1 hypothetical protein [Verrucomicrobiota bacterium]
MRSRRRRNPSLLGEAFAMKESDGWETVADTIHIQEEIERRRRRVLLLLGLGILIAASLAVIISYLIRG